MPRKSTAQFVEAMVEERFPEGRVAARVRLRREPRTRELSYTPSAVQTLDRLRAIIRPVRSSSTPGHFVALREALGWSVKQFSQAVDVQETVVRKWESGDGKPSATALRHMRTLQRRATSFGISSPAKAG